MNYTSSKQTVGLVALPQGRSYLVFALLLAGLLGLIIRAGYLQGINNDFLQRKGDARYGRVIDIHAHRGMITDRHGKPLAISTPVESVWASPTDVVVTSDQIKKLAQILGMTAKDVKARLTDTTRDFVYLKRQLPPEVARKVAELEVPGVLLRREYRRYYPDGGVTSHLIGFTDLDDNGQEGLELAFQKDLRGQLGSQRVIKDRRGYVIEDVASVRAPKPGSDLALSIDSKLQYLAYREIKQAVEQHRAKSGSIVILDSSNGEVLALANWPSYNPNNRAKPSLNILRNRAVTDLFEPGSTMKPFTIAAALDAGTVTPRTKINTEHGVMTISGRKIHDTHPEFELSVTQVLQKSSNIGTAKLALAMQPEFFWKHLGASGFGTAPGSHFPGEAGGKLRNHKTWRPIEQATISYGHGISVSLLQLARAYAVFANDGELKPVSLLKLNGPVSGEQAYSPASARAVRDMMELVVGPEGTAPLAQVNGYRVAGKTGTAHKLEGGRYTNRYIASFVGLAPASNPRLIVAVMIDEPNGKAYYGGLVAAPIFSNVMGAALHLLNVPNDAPLEKVLMPGLTTEAEVKEEV